MSITNTTLTNNIGPSDLGPFLVGSTTGFPTVNTYGSRQLMRIDGEDMLIDYVPVSGSVKVLQRGYNGTVAAAHEALAVIATSSSTADFGDVPSGAVVTRPPSVDDIVSIGVDTTFTAAGTAATATTLPLPIKNTIYMITKATAAAITLISGVSAQMGVKMTFQNAIAAANTVTYTPGFRGDTTSSDVATAAAKVGVSFVITCGYTGLWGDQNTGTGTGWTLG